MQVRLVEANAYKQKRLGFSGLQALRERFQLSAVDGKLPLLQFVQLRQKSRVLLADKKTLGDARVQTSLCRPSDRRRSSTPPSGWPSPRFPPSCWSREAAGSLQPVGSERVLHSRVGEHQVAVQHVQSQGVHPERVVQGEGVHLEAGDVRQSAGDLFRQTRRRVACGEGRRADTFKHRKQKQNNNMASSPPNAAEIC